MVGKIVKSHTTGAKYVTNFASKKREELSKNLKKSIENGVRFSLTADEVTLLNCKRYLNITLKTPTEKINLGLKRITTSDEAFVCKLKYIVQNFFFFTY